MMTPTAVVQGGAVGGGVFRGGKARRVGLTAVTGLHLLMVIAAGQLATLWAGTLPAAATGANVDESLVGKTYHVDAANADAADDDNHGTPDAPFATISYACQVAVRDKDHHVGARVLVAAGTYRETVEIRPPPGGGPDTDAPLVIESAERGQAIIDGADTEGWSASTWKTDGPNWTHPWPFRRDPARQAAWERTLRAGGAPPGASGEAFRRGDLVVVNNATLRQVNRLEELAPGCFWGRPPAPAANGRPARGEPPAPRTATTTAAADPAAALIIQPPTDTALEGAIIQVGVREHCLVAHGRRNVVLRGLVLQHAAAPTNPEAAASGLLLDDCSNVLVEDVFSQWNDGAGLVILGRAAVAAKADFTLRQTHLLHNSGSGLAALNVGNLLVEDGEACFNNFRGEWASWIDPEGSAGVKLRNVRGSAWRRLRAVGNFCRGGWWDGENANVTLEDGTVRDNVVDGLLFTSDPGPVLVRRCLVAGTKSFPGMKEEAVYPAGISVAATPDVTLESNIVAGNAVAQLGLWDVAGGSHPTKPALRDERHAYRRNVFYAADEGGSVYSLPAADVDKGAWASFYDTLEAGENCFWNPAQVQAFCLRGGGAPKPAGASAAGGRTAVTLEGWSALLAAHGHPQDAATHTDDRTPEAGSLWQDPLFADPAEGDYRLREQSPVAGWNLPADEGATAP